MHPLVDVFDMTSAGMGNTIQLFLMTRFLVCRLENQ